MLIRRDCVVLDNNLEMSVSHHAGFYGQRNRGDCPTHSVAHGVFNKGLKDHGWNYGLVGARLQIHFDAEAIGKTPSLQFQISSLKLYLFAECYFILRFGS